MARQGMRARIWIALAVTGVAMGLAPAAASAAFGVANNCTTPTGTTCWVAGVYNADYTGMNDRNYLGSPAQQSGAHPFVGVTDFTVATTGGVPDGVVSSIRVDVPGGLDSNPQATPKCTSAQLTSSACPADTQLGIVKLEADASPSPTVPLDVFVGESVYNVTPDASDCPSPSYVSDFAFYVAALKERVNICGADNRQFPYNNYFTISVPPGAATVSSTLIFWGVPGDSGHNSQHGWSCLQATGPCTPPASGPSAPHGTPFLTNPTACVPAGAASTLTLGSSTGQQATATSTTPVPAIGCGSLGFSPLLKLALTGKHQTAVGKHPTLTATLTYASGQANIALSKVTLPLSLALDPRNSEHVCSVAAAATDTCPASTLIGKATAVTPLLSQPLSGPVYLVQGIRTLPSGQQIRTLPALLVELRGQAAIDLHAQTSVSNNHLVTTFSALPDQPVSKFTLTISGGKRGILVVTGSRSLCKASERAPTLLVGQNGKQRRRTVTMTTPCAPKRKHHG
jgi:hypothetical protein